MPDGSRDAHIPLSDEALHKAEHQALIAAVAQARADPHPPISHEKVRAEIMAEIEELERRIAVSLAAPPTA